MTTLRKRFDTVRGQRSFHALPTIQDDGLTLGRGTVLARMAVTRSGEICLAVEADQERILALLSATYGWQVDHSFMKQIDRASTKWQCGDKAGAHIELAFARFPRLRSDEDAFHLFVADDLLARGMTPRRLVRELGFDDALLRYDPNQPRVPAGSGRESGRWASATDGAVGAPRSSTVSPGDNNGGAPDPSIASVNGSKRTSVKPADNASTYSSDTPNLTANPVQVAAAIPQNRLDSNRITITPAANADDPQGLKQARAAARAAGLTTKADLREFHRLITGLGITDFQELVEIAKTVKKIAFR